jgi:uncharacterized protein (DUF58 family)
LRARFTPSAGGNTPDDALTSRASPVVVRRRDLIALRPVARYLAIGQHRAPERHRRGQHVAPLRGRGLDHDDVRPYQPGDDLRLVEWKALARTGRVYTRLYREERERSLHLLVDFRRSMRFGTRGMLKSVMAARVAALLAWTAVAEGDRVGATIVTERGRIDLPPASGRRGVLTLILALVKAHATTPDDDGETPELGSLFSFVLHRVPSGSALVPISDFQGLNDASRHLLDPLSRRFDLFGCFIYDPLEREAPPPGLYPATDGHRRGHLDFSDPHLREAHQRRFEERAEGVRTAFVDHRAWLLRLSTEHDPVDSVQRLLHARRRGNPG